MEWQPIETAPKDGTRILVFRENEDGHEQKRIGVDFFNKGVWWLSRTQMRPIHWMPLPPPPE